VAQQNLRGKRSLVLRATAAGRLLADPGAWDG